jgi:hydrogenase maturation protease
VIGVGNAWRRDDGAGVAVAAALGGTCTDQPGRLLDLWANAAHVIVVDAAASGAAPGTIHRFDVTSAPLPASIARSSTHTFGVADAIELARALGRLPARMDVYAIEGADYTAGEGLTPAVARAAETLANELRAGWPASASPPRRPRRRAP